jgi:ion channel POLLUX/CASTOR
MLRKIRYLLFLSLTTRAVFPYLLLIFVMGVVVTFGMLSYFAGLFSEDALRAEGIDNLLGGKVIDSFWWSLKHVLDPGSFSENYGAPFEVIIFALINSIFGLVLTGGLIGLIVNSLQNALELAKLGASNIVEEGHLIILGWNRKGPSLLRQFFSLKNSQRVVILSRSSPEEVKTSLKSEGLSKRNQQLLILKGEATSNAVLDRIGVSKSAHVIILAEGLGHEDAFSDVNTINSLMRIGGLQPNIKGPNISAEIVDAERLGIAKIASSTHPLVCTSLLVSKTMVQCARNPGYASVYKKLFSINELDFELVPCEKIDGALFADACLMVSNATVIGVSWDKKLEDGSLKRVTALNPEPDYDLAGDDQLVVINRRGSRVIVNTEAKAKNRSGLTELSERPNLNKVIIFSSNPNLPAIVSELALNSSSMINITIACRKAETVVDNLRDWISINNPTSINSLTLEPFEFDLTQRWSLDEIDIFSYDSILILADESEANVDADSSTALILLILEGVVKRGGTLPPIVVELLSSKTRSVIKNSTIIDSVISTEFVSSMLLQVVRNPFLESIYSELLSAGGIEMGFRQLDNFSIEGTHICYSELQSRAFEKNELIIGYQIGDGENAIVELNPEKEAFKNLNLQDKLIVLSQQLYT